VNSSRTFADVNKGEVHAIMGPNGSGKSTLSHVIAGKPGYEVTGGEILFEGEDLLAMSPDERSPKGVFLAFQHPVEIPGVATMTFLRTALNAPDPGPPRAEATKVTQVESFIAAEGSRATVTRLPAACPSLVTTPRMRSIRWPSPWSRHRSFSHE
jgi:Fe-S cluster assembly ATPase SufC